MKCFLIVDSTLQLSCVQISFELHWAGVCEMLEFAEGYSKPSSSVSVCFKVCVAQLWSLLEIDCSEMRKWLPCLLCSYGSS